MPLLTGLRGLGFPRQVRASPRLIDHSDRIAVMDGYKIKGTMVNDRDYERMSREIMGLIHLADAA